MAYAVRHSRKPSPRYRLSKYPLAVVIAAYSDGSCKRITLQSLSVGWFDMSDRYILQVSEHELNRLRLQSKILSAFTRRALLSANVSVGMQVLDVGTGIGDVACIAADIVGSAGHVHGVDIEPTMITAARSEARVRNVPNVTFEAIGNPSLSDMRCAARPKDGYDVVVGRFVLAQQAHPLQFLKSLSARLKPGGTCLIIETANPGRAAWSSPPVPDYDELVRILFDMTQELGHDHTVGVRMASLFKDAGFAEPSMIGELLLGGASSEVLSYMLMNMKVILPQGKTAMRCDLNAESLSLKLSDVRNQVKEASSQIVGQCVVAAWATPL